MNMWDVRVEGLDLGDELRLMLTMGAPNIEVTTVWRAGITATLQADTAVDAAIEILTFLREAYPATGPMPQWPSIAVYAARSA